jgi:uncharacterized phage protein gp47/JayE
MVLTDNGFSRPTYADLLDLQIARAKKLFGDDIETNEQTILGKFIRLNVYEISELYELLEYVYYARFPSTATGISLDRLCLFAGITRNLATQAIHIVRLYGEVDAEIEAGSLTVGTSDNITFYLLNGAKLSETIVDKDIVLDGQQIAVKGDKIGFTEALFACVDVGNIGNVSVGSIKSIINPNTSITAIEHIGVDTYGADTETDISLRNRFETAIAGIGSGTIDSIYGAIWRVSDVSGCYIIENNTSETVEGRPPKSFECYVLGGDDIDVANAIFSKLPVGVETVSTATSESQRSIDVEDIGGTKHTIKFSRTVEKKIYIKVNVAVNSSFDEGGISDIKDNIVKHIAQLTNGDDVIYSSLFSDVHSVDGVVSAKIQLSTDSSVYVTNDITVAGSEVARTNTAIIEVTTDDYIDS